MNIQMIPLNCLIPSPANVRKTGTGIGVEELAASIAAHGLLQNLQVRPAKGGKFEVAAGGRRLAALKLLVKQKQMPRLAEIACNVFGDEDAGEISLAENTIRVPMHPADQFDAFKALADTGKGAEEIAGRFGCTAAVVRQRLKLAAVSPRLMDVYRDEDMDLDQLMAFTVSDDHEAQEAAWFDQPSHNRYPNTIRRILTAAQVEADDRLALFVGVEAYVAAGGTLNRDLFQADHQGYLTDPALLNRLAMEKLQGEADAIRAEGWAWVEIVPELEWDTLRRFGRAEPQRQPLSESDAEELDRLGGEYDALSEQHGDDPEPEIAEQLEVMSARIDALTEGNEVWTAEDMARSGAIVGIDSDGTPAVERGLIRREDKQDETVAEDGEAPSPALPSNITGLSDRLVEDLTAHRTAALRVMLADNPAVALAAVTYALALPLFYNGTGTCLALRAESPNLRSSADGIADSRAAQAWDEREAAWTRRLPSEADGLWDWMMAQSADTLTGLLACCAASTVSAVRKARDKVNAPHLTHADQLAAQLGLDMAQWWQPTASSFFGRIPKVRILEAVTEACSKQTAENLVKLKKDALAKRAEEKLTGTGWLPSVLRPAANEAPAPEIAEAA
jgi:ParB family transcriptional regulator, chromosome partitioning protein